MIYKTLKEKVIRKNCDDEQYREHDLQKCLLLKRKEVHIFFIIDNYKSYQSELLNTTKELTYT